MIADAVVSGKLEYSSAPALQGGVNSNSAAQAVGNRINGSAVPIPGRLKAPGAAQADRVKFKPFELPSKKDSTVDPRRNREEPESRLPMSPEKRP